MNLLELIDKKELSIQEARNLVEASKQENRKLSQDETQRFESLVTEAKNLKNQITEINEADKKGLTKPTITTITRKMEQFNLIEVIRNEVDRRSQSDANREVLEAGAKSYNSGLECKGQIQLPFEYRSDIVAGSNPVVAIDKFNLLAPLRAKLVAVAAGAQLITGLAGNVSIPTYTGSSASWAATETAAAADGAGTFAEITLSPKRLTAYLDVSKQFLAQDSINAQGLLMSDLVDAVAGKLESSIWGKAASVASQPDGFYTGVLDANLVVKGASSWAKAVALEAAIDSSNALQGNLAYITNATGKSFLKSAPKVSGQAIFLMDGNEMNGYPVYVTNHMATGLATAANEHGLMFGNFNDLIIGQWGGIDILVDPYSQAVNGKIRLVINCYFDVKKRRTASFACGSVLS